MKKLFKYIRPYLLYAILGPLCMLFEVVMDLFQPMYMQKIVDIGIVNMDMNYVLNTLILMIIVSALGALGGIGGSLFAPKVAFNAGADIRNDLFEKVQSLSFSNIDKLDTGNLITRLTNDVVQVERIIVLSLRIMVRAPFQIIGSFIMVFIISKKLSIILVIAAPILALFVILVINKGYPLFKTVQEKLDKVNRVMQENLLGIRVVKAFVRKDYEEKRFGMANNDFSSSSVNALKVVSLISPVMMLILNLAVIAVIWFGGIEVNKGSLKVGEVMAFINYLQQLLTALMMVARISIMISKAEASANRICEVLETNPEIIDSNDAININKIKGEIEFKDVSFSYGKNKEFSVLKNINFKANPGEKVAILGSTGSGKTSLVNLIPRFYEIYQGSITLDGIDIRKITMKSLRKNIGICLQETILFSGTILDNICYGKKDVPFKDVKETATIVQADNFIMNFENGYKTNLNQRGVNLSGGQKQRIAIARALIIKPPILILDDSTSALDVTTEAHIQDALNNNLKNTTIIMVAQRISSVLDADKILVLDEGTIVAEGNHNELIKTSKVYRDIYNSQLGKGGDEYAE